MLKHKTKIRNAHMLDLIPLAKLADEYYKEVQTMKNHPLSMTKLMEGLAATILSPDGYLKVAEYDDKIVGGFWGILTNQPWSEAKLAQDVMIFVSSGYRGNLGLSLIRDWINWSKEMGAVEVLLSTASGIDTERFISLAEHLGFSRAGHAFVKEV